MIRGFSVPQRQQRGIFRQIKAIEDGRGGVPVRYAAQAQPKINAELAEKHRCRGFTLLEVMIALAIISIALVTLLGLSNRSIGVNHRLQRITQATLLAQQQMAEIEVAANRTDFQLEAQDGLFDPPFEEYRWRIEYDETPLPFVHLVKVTVAWGEEEKNEAVDLTSFIYRAT